MATKEQIFREVYKNSLIRDAYFEKIPTDICMAFIDNKYVNNLLHERDMMLRLLFAEHADAVGWFLYEWKPGMRVEDTKINNIDEYIDYMKKNEGFE